MDGFFNKRTPFNVTSRDVPMSASTANHMLPRPNNTSIRKMTLIPMLTATLVRIVDMAARLKRMANGSCLSELPINVMSAVSMAWQ